MKRGEIYLVNFGKIRPALIIQNDIANRNIDKVEFKGVSVLPLTINISGGSLRVKINKRENLQQVSEVCVNEICTLDLKRIDFSKLLTTAREEEQNEIDGKLKKHLGV